MIPCNKVHFGNIFRRKKNVLARLSGVQKSLSERENDYLTGLEKELIQEYNQILYQEEIFWFQKSRVKWMVVGKRNMKFFHQSTIMRRRRNKIMMLKIDNEWIKNDETLREHAFHHFASQFQEASRSSRRTHSLQISRFQTTLSTDDIDHIGRAVDLKEPREVV